MGTALPKSEIAALVAAITGFPAGNVIWAGDPEPFLGPGADGKVYGKIVLNCAARKIIGVDEEKRSYPDPNTTVIDTKGQRALTISVRVEGYASDEAFDILELLRTELGRDENRETLRAAGVAYTGTADVQMLNGTAENRAISVGQMDVTMNMAVSTTKTIAQPGYIESVQISGDNTTDLNTTRVPPFDVP